VIDIHPQPPVPPETAAEREERLQSEAHIAQFAHIRVPTEIERLHPLTRLSKRHFEDIARKLKRPQRSGVGLRSDWLSLPSNRNGRYSCSPSEGFDLLVSLDGVDRALRFLDTLAKSLEKYGFALRVNQEKRRLEALKDKEVAAFELREGYKRIPLDAAEVARRRAVHSWSPDYEWKGSGKFIFRMFGENGWSHREWQDGKKSLEEQLPEVVAEFVGFPDAVKADRAARAKAAEEQARLERIAAQTRQRVEAEQREFQRFLNEAQRASLLRQASAYLTLLEEKLAGEKLDPSGPAVAWLSNMHRLFARSDPLHARLEAIKTLAMKEPLQPSYSYYSDHESDDVSGQ